MEVLRLDDMVRGWFVGDFEPTLYRTTDVEVAVKDYVAGDTEARHYHKIATELTVVVAGVAEMDGRRIGPGEIVVLRPGESSDFLAITNVTLVAVKLPGAKADKYVVEEP